MTEHSELAKRLLKAANDAWTFACEDESLGSNAAMTMVVDAIVNAMPDPLTIVRDTMIAEMAGLPMESQYRAGIKWCGERILDALKSRGFSAIAPTTLEQSNAS